MKFDADRPIESGNDDLLERRPFAERIARQILDVPTEDGFTIAVAGPWGSGKTSVLNMITETIDADRLVLRFNPWLFSGQEELVARFFQELAAQIGQGGSAKHKNVAQTLTNLGKALAPLSPIAGTSTMAELASRAADHWAKPQSLLAQHQALKKSLSESESKILVIVDDIDRLESGETRELMRLIRLLSNLPNVVFLLAYDRERVAKSLDNDPGEGRNYLEKIVQLTYDMPSVRRDILEAIFFDALNNIVVERKLDLHDKQVWQRVFFDIIRPLLGNLRDVKRLLHSLPVTFDAVGDEVALTDLLGLEAIRVLRPGMFEDLRANADYLVNSPETSWHNLAEQDARKQIKEVLEAMLARAGANRHLLSSVLRLLFPLTQQHLETGTVIWSMEASWRRNRRVATPEVLRIYLQAGIDADVIPSQEVRKFVRALTDVATLTALMEPLDGQQLEAVLARLEDYAPDFRADTIPIAVPALLNQLHKLSPDPATMLGISPQMRARRVLIQLLRTSQSQEALGAKMDEMLDKIDSLSGRFMLVREVGYRQDVGSQLIGLNQADSLERKVMEDLEAADAAQLASEWDLWRIAQRILGKLDGEEKARLTKHLREHLSYDQFVMRLLRGSANTAFKDGVPERRLFWDGLLEDYGDEFPLAVARLIEASKGHELGAPDREALDLAQKYLDGWRPAISEDL